MVLTIPVENLLMLVPYKTHLPFAGLASMGQSPLVAEDKGHKASSMELVSPSL